MEKNYWIQTNYDLSSQWEAMDLLRKLEGKNISLEPLMHLYAPTAQEVSTGFSHEGGTTSGSLYRFDDLDNLVKLFNLDEELTGFGGRCVKSRFPEIKTVGQIVNIDKNGSAYDNFKERLFQDYDFTLVECRK